MSEIIFWIFAWIMLGVCAYALGRSIGFRKENNKKDKSERNEWHCSNNTNNNLWRGCHNVDNI